MVSFDRKPFEFWRKNRFWSRLEVLLLHHCWENLWKIDSIWFICYYWWLTWWILESVCIEAHKNKNWTCAQSCQLQMSQILYWHLKAIKSYVIWNHGSFFFYQKSRKTGNKWMFSTQWVFYWTQERTTYMCKATIKLI